MNKLQAKLGSISSGTLRDCDLLSAFVDELEWQLRRNGEFYSRPENHAERDRINNLIGEAKDCFAEDGEAIEEAKRGIASELINETLFDALNEFAPPYAHFGAHPGDGADFGYWPEDIENIKEQMEFVSSEEQEWPADDFQGEWLHINERGNCSLYVREKGQDKEIWSVC
jgi:hypothetical protein